MPDVTASYGTTLDFIAVFGIFTQNFTKFSEIEYKHFNTSCQILRQVIEILHLFEI